MSHSTNTIVNKGLTTDRNASAYMIIKHSASSGRTVAPDIYSPLYWSSEKKLDQIKTMQSTRPHVP